jgi:hypothetical protein
MRIRTPLLRPFRFTIDIDIMATNPEKAIKRFNKLTESLTKVDKEYNTYIRIGYNFDIEDSGKAKDRKRTV